MKLQNCEITQFMNLDNYNQKLWNGKTMKLQNGKVTKLWTD